MAKKVIIDIDIQGTGDVIKLQEQIKATKKELRETKDVGTFEQLSKELIKLQSDLKEARKAQRQAVDAFTATNEGVGAYSRLSAELRVARNRLKDLQAAGVVSGDEVTQLTARVGELDTQLKNIDRSVGQANREIGQYEEAVRKAVGITDAQTGAFTRLKGRADVLRKAYRDVAAESGKNSDQAKKLRKELERVENQLKAVSGSAQRSAKRIGGLRSQLRNLGPAFTGLASGFLAFSEAPQIISELGEGFATVARFISPAFALNERFNESLEEGAKQLVKEKAELDATFEAALNSAEGTDERKEAIERVNEQYGDYLPALLEESASLEEIELAQRQATAALIEDIAAQQTREQVLKIFDEFAEASARTIEIQRESESAIGQTADFLVEKSTGLVDFFLGATGTFTTSLTDINKGFNEANKKNLIDQAGATGELNANLVEGFTEINAALEAAGFDLASIAEGNQEEIEKARKERQEAAEKRALEQAKKAAERRRKQEQRAADRLEQQQQRAREKFIQDEIRQNERRTALINQLEADLITATLNNQEDSLEKLQKLETDATNKRIDALKAQRQKFINEAKEQQRKVNEAFGEGSQESIKLQEKLFNQRVSIEKKTDALIEQERLASTQRLEKIEEDFNSKQAEDAKKALEDRLAQLQEERQAVAGEVEGELLDIRQKRAQGQIAQQEADNQAFNARIANLKKQVERINQQEQVLIDIGIEDTSEEFQGLVLERKKLNTELAELEEEQTKKVQEEAQKRADATREGFEQAADAFLKSTELIGTIADLANQKAIEEIEREQAQSEQRLTDLQSELETASGLEAQFLQEEIEREVKAQEELNQKRARAEKEAAIAKKAIAITEAIINTALGVSAALTVGPPVSFILAALTGALGAAQIATIASQPIAKRGGIEGETFARGGMVVGRSHAQGGEKFAVGGRVVELEGGEAVINKRSTAMFRDKLSAMNVAGGGVKFQAGGIAGAPINAPNLGESFAREDRTQQLQEQNAELLQATNNRIDRLQVVYTTATDEAIQEDKRDMKEIRQTATL